MADDKVAVEAEIRATVRDAAEARARSQARQLHDVARALLVSASKGAEPSDDGVAHPARRPVDAERRRLRFRMPRGEYEVCRDRIRSSGSSVTRVLEEELERYARTGKL